MSGKWSDHGNQRRPVVLPAVSAIAEWPVVARSFNVELYEALTQLPSRGETRDVSAGNGPIEAYEMTMFT